jgi:hypothetical protein
MWSGGRYECRECPGEYCLCGDCYDDESTLHPHDCVLSRLDYHVTVLEGTAGLKGRGQGAGGGGAGEAAVETIEEVRR